MEKKETIDIRLRLPMDLYLVLHKIKSENGYKNWNDFFIPFMNALMESRELGHEIKVCACGEPQTDQVKQANHIGLQEWHSKGERLFVWNCPRCGTNKMEKYKVSI